MMGRVSCSTPLSPVRALGPGGAEPFAALRFEFVGLCGNSVFVVFGWLRFNFNGSGNFSFCVFVVQTIFRFLL